MQDERRTLTHLKKIPLFKELPRPELARLADEGKVSDHRRRRVVYMPGDPGGSVFGIVTGRVKISRVTPDGKELTLAYRLAGELFGENCLFLGEPREEMAETADHTVLIEFPRQLVEELLAAHVELALEMTRTLLERRRALERKIEDLIFKDVNAKLAELLLSLAKRYGLPEPRGTLISVKVTHQEMANLIGSTRETVSLALSQFKRQKLIHLEARRVIIADREALQSLV
ncbi:MAG: Crp/Fnr family transcriptional regulator [Proteobacteria bacterium]|nr:Crp/Fnr family transcriptional regulator [Pseudomonadota bacterium]